MGGTSQQGVYYQGGTVIRYSGAQYGAPPTYTYSQAASYPAIQYAMPTYASNTSSKITYMSQPVAMPGYQMVVMPGTAPAVVPGTSPAVSVSQDNTTTSVAVSKSTKLKLKKKSRGGCC